MSVVYEQELEGHYWPAGEGAGDAKSLERVRMLLD